MENIGESVSATPQEEATSAVLNENEIQEALGEAPEEEVVLPSEQEEFELPEKFKGKSVEEVAKAYTELEKLKDKQATEEPKVEPTEESTDKESDEVDLEDYYKKYVETGELDVEALTELGVDVDEVREQFEYASYKQQKAIDAVLAPLGVSLEEATEAAAWLSETKGEAEAEELNKALATSTVAVQQVLIKGLMDSYKEANNITDVLHTNEPQSIPTQGYKTQEEFFKDIGSPEYTNNPKFREKVEKKMAKSDIF